VLGKVDDRLPQHCEFWSAVTSADFNAAVKSFTAWPKDLDVDMTSQAWFPMDRS
jgi:hypothetical protein